MRLGPDPCVHAGCGPVLWDYPVLFLVVVVVGGGDSSGSLDCALCFMKGGGREGGRVKV